MGGDTAFDAPGKELLLGAKSFDWVVENPVRYQRHHSNSTVYTTTVLKVDLELIQDKLPEDQYGRSEALIRQFVDACQIPSGSTCLVDPCFHWLSCPRRSVGRGLLVVLPLFGFREERTLPNGLTKRVPTYKPLEPCTDQERADHFRAAKGKKLVILTTMLLNLPNVPGTVEQWEAFGKAVTMRLRNWAVVDALTARNEGALRPTIQEHRGLFPRTKDVNKATRFLTKDWPHDDGDSSPVLSCSPRKSLAQVLQDHVSEDSGDDVGDGATARDDAGDEDVVVTVDETGEAPGSDDTDEDVVATVDAIGEATASNDAGEEVVVTVEEMGEPVVAASCDMGDAETVGGGAGEALVNDEEASVALANGEGWEASPRGRTPPGRSRLSLAIREYVGPCAPDTRLTHRIAADIAAHLKDEAAPDDTSHVTLAARQWAKRNRESAKRIFNDYEVQELTRFTLWMHRAYEQFGKAHTFEPDALKSFLRDMGEDVRDNFERADEIVEKVHTEINHYKSQQALNQRMLSLRAAAEAPGPSRVAIVGESADTVHYYDFKRLREMGADLSRAATKPWALQTQPRFPSSRLPVVAGISAEHFVFGGAGGSDVKKAYDDFLRANDNLKEMRLDIFKSRLSFAEIKCLFVYWMDRQIFWVFVVNMHLYAIAIMAARFRFDEERLTTFANSSLKRSQKATIARIEKKIEKWQKKEPKDRQVIKELKRRAKEERAELTKMESKTFRRLPVVPCYRCGGYMDYDTAMPPVGYACRVCFFSLGANYFDQFEGSLVSKEVRLQIYLDQLKADPEDIAHRPAATDRRRLVHDVNLLVQATDKSPMPEHLRGHRRLAHVQARIRLIWANEDLLYIFVILMLMIGPNTDALLPPATQKRPCWRCHLGGRSAKKAFCILCRRHSCHEAIDKLAYALEPKDYTDEEWQRAASVVAEELRTHNSIKDMEEKFRTVAIAIHDSHEDDNDS